MKRIISEGIILAAAAAVSLPVSADTPGVKVEHLGVNNTLVRVDGDARYLLMPVQEANDDARINILVDGKLDRTMYVRLAKSKTDYMVPFDLTPYKGKNVVLNIDAKVATFFELTKCCNIFFTLFHIDKFTINIYMTNIQPIVITASNSATPTETAT